MKAIELARRLECELEGETGIEITGIAGLDEAGAGDLSFLLDRRWNAKAARTRAGAILAGKDFVPSARSAPLAILRSLHPEQAMIAAMHCLRPRPRPQPGVHATASVHPSARLGRNCTIGPFVSIGAGCRLGDDAVLYPHAVLYEDVEAGDRLTVHAHVVIREGTRIGNDVVLQPGVVVGGDGFGFHRREDGSYEKIPQLGNVVIGDGVEIQANSCIDRATLATTRLGAGVKIDNLTQVGHNCQLADNVLLCAQVGLAGSTEIEAGAVLAGQAGVAGHCRIGAGAIITAQSGTHGDLEGGRMYSGSPAFAHADWLRSTAVFSRLGDLQREVRRLRTEMEKMQKCD